MQSLRILFAVIVIAIASSAAAENATNSSGVNIVEWQVPWEATVPRDPFAVNEHSVWFVGQGGSYLGQLNPSTGEFTQVKLKNSSAPHNVIVATDGGVWYAGNRTGLVGRYDPATGKTLEVMMPHEAAKDPHTLVFDEGEKNIWFTLQQSNMIGRLNIASQNVDLIKVETARARPYGIKMAPDGSVWVVLFGTNKLAHIDPESLGYEEIDLPRSGARPRRLELLDDGQVWYVDYAEGILGVYNPGTRKFREWSMPQGEHALPYGMASDESGHLWIAVSGVQPNIFMGFDPATESFFAETEIPSGAGTIRHMHYHQSTGTVWFGTDANTIGRAIVEPVTSK